MSKFWINAVLGIYLAATVSAKSVSSESSEESKRDPPESLKEFVKIVEKYNLNVTLIGSQKKYAPKGWIKEQFAVTLHMPTNDAFVTQATLTDEKQAKYLEKIKKITRKEKVGAVARVVAIKDGRDEILKDDSVNEQYRISSANYNYFVGYIGGKRGFQFLENETNAVLHNYLIKDGDVERQVKVITGHVKVKVIDKGVDFPEEELTEVDNVIQKLWMSIDDNVLLARLLVQHMDKKFPANNHQAMIGVKNFAIGTEKFANFKVADSNLLLFSL
ncbi:uncharacterized protein LOC132699781 [Cylas formicarius]|uniref:uncharacterized protein LOC132699781 n=1 Tax=Cylas formicarius TaxID=197179 RepID=UPI002958377D|nr:uncharacterized protein LOC132699781 [Cylas formicarius]